MPVRVLVSTVIAYLLGSVSPAYLLGRIIRGIDIRSEGYRNAGARNVYHVLGAVPAAVTALIDLGKGIAAVAVARYLLSVPDLLLVFPAAAAVLGHIFPFYLKFRGGKGMATAVGIYLFACLVSITSGRFAAEQLLAVLVVAALVFLASRNGDLTGLVAFFFLSVVTTLQMGFASLGLLMSGLALFTFAMSIRNVTCHKVFVFDSDIEIKWWRIIARPFALLFVPIDMFFGRTFLLFLVGGLSVVFIGMDVFRLLTRYQLRRLFKSKESKRFSSMTSFLVAIFIIFLVFPDIIPYLGLAYITMGDMFSKIIGIKFGTTRLFRERTLQGSMGFLAGSYMAGWVLYTLLSMPLYALLAGPPFAAAVELFSMDLDDNFTVGIVSSGFLFALRYFLKL